MASTARIGTLTIGMTAETDKMAAGLKKGQVLLGGFGRDISGYTSKLAAFGVSAAPVALGLGAIAAEAAIAFTVVKHLSETLYDLGMKQAEVILKTNIAAQSIAVATDSLAAFEYAAGQAGSEVEGLVPAIQKMNKNIGDAARLRTGTGFDAIKDLGLDVNELAAQAPEKTFLQLADAIKKLPTESARASASMAIFGRGAASIRNLLSQGSEGIEAYRRKFVALGASFNDVDAAKLRQADDAIASAKTGLTGIGNTLAIEIAPIVAKVADDLVQFEISTGGFKTYFHYFVEDLKVAVVYFDQLAAVAEQSYNLLSFKGIDVKNGAFGHAGQYLADAAAEADKAARKTAGGLAGERAGVKGGPDDDEQAAAAASLKTGEDYIASLQKRLTALKYNSDATAELAEKTAGLGATSKDTAQRLLSEVDAGEARAAAIKAQADANKKGTDAINSLKEEIATFGKSKDAVELYRLTIAKTDVTIVNQVSSLQKQKAALEASAAATAKLKDEQQKQADEMTAARKAVLDDQKSPLQKYQEESKRLQSFGLKPDEVKKQLKGVWDSLNSEGKSLAESVMSPAEKFNEEMKHYQELLEGHQISPEVFKRLQAKQLGELPNPNDHSHFAAAVSINSAESRSAILKNAYGGNSANTAAEKQQVSLDQILYWQRRGAQALEKVNVEALK